MNEENMVALKDVINTLSEMEQAGDIDSLIFVAADSDGNEVSGFVGPDIRAAIASLEVMKFRMLCNQQVEQDGMPSDLQ